MRVSLGMPLLLALAFVAGMGEARQSPPSNITQRLQQLASQTTHFATGDIVYNRWSDSRWPIELLKEQQRVLEELRVLSRDRAAVVALLGNADPRLRTFALGALFIREDPHDLPVIAGFLQDDAGTFTRLGMALTSAGGPLPLAQFQSPQKVSDVARSMIGFYLSAAGRPSVSTLDSGAPAFPSGAFDEYWAERSNRKRCASWFLVKMRRATRQVSPFHAEYETDVRRVLAEIDTLPPVERAWTLLYVRADLGQIEVLVPDAVLVTALQAVGPEALLTFLRRESPTDDPDVRAGHAYPGSMTGFILDYAPRLLRAGDADAVAASAQAYRSLQNNTWFVAAAARLRGLNDIVGATESLKAEIQRIPVTRTLGPQDRATLALALWRMRGAAERAFLTDWFYTALPFVGSPDALEYFLRDLEKEARPDTSLLLATIVGDARFDQIGWSPLARILEMVNKTLRSPIVDSATIYRYTPNSGRPDEQATLAGWRQLLRQHFGVR
jgi:hypothetical protein